MAFRVAYVLLWFPEPSQTFILDEINTLRGQGLDVKVYTLYGPRPRWRLAGLESPLAPVFHLGTAALGDLWRDLGSLSRWGQQAAPFLRRVLVRRWRSPETAGEALWAALAGVHLARQFLADGVEHIHAPWADGPATAAWVASSLSFIPFSFAAHAHDIYPPDGALLEKLTAATWVRAISEANRRYLASLAPGETGKIIKIPIGNPLVGASKPAVPLPTRPPYRLLALGRLVAKKGFASLIEACRILSAQGFEFHLTLAGDGPQRSHLSRVIRKARIESRVSLPGFVPHREVPQLFRESDLFIMPSVITPSGDRDGIPTVILEALAHEVPVVATDVSGIPELIRPGETGWLAPPSDPKALAQVILEALADPTEARCRAQRGRELVKKQFDSQKNYALLKTCLEKQILPIRDTHHNSLMEACTWTNQSLLLWHFRLSGRGNSPREDE
jgi:glycosyltransferase involved in cell wall biosynthesis